MVLFVAEWKRNEVPQPADIKTDERSPVLATNRRVVGVWDAITRQKISEISIQPEFENGGANGKMRGAVARMRSMSISPGGEIIALAYGRETVICSVQTGEKLSQIKHHQHSQSNEFTNGGKRLIDSSGHIFDVETGEKRDSLPTMSFGRYLNGIQINPKRELVAATAWQKGIVLLDLETNKSLKLEQPKGTHSMLYVPAFSNNGKLLAAASYMSRKAKKNRPKVFVWDVDTKKIVASFDLSGGYLSRLVFSADSQQLYSKSHGEFGVSKWTIGNGNNSERRLSGNKTPIGKFLFSQDGKSLIAASSQGGVIVYDLETGAPIDDIFCRQSSYLNSTAHGEHIVIGSMQSSFTLYNTQDKKSKTVQFTSYSRPSIVSRLASVFSKGADNYEFEHYSMTSIAITEGDEEVLIAAKGQRHFRCERFNIATGKRTFNKRYKMSEFWDVDGSESRNNYWREHTMAVSRDGQQIAILGGSSVYLVETESGVLLHEIEDIGEVSSKLYFTPDSSRLLVAKATKLSVRDTDSGEEVEKFKLGDSGQITGIAISRDGTRLVAISGGSSNIKVFDLDTGEEVFSKKTKENYVGVGISNDGKKIALAKPNCQFEVWDLNKLEK